MFVDSHNPFASAIAPAASPAKEDAKTQSSFGDVFAQAVAATQDTGKDASAGQGADEEATLIERIREKGFSAFVQDLKEEKLEELRRKILESMGFSEEDLQNMSPEQRAQVEQIVANEIVKRMLAHAALNGEARGSMGGMQMVEQTVSVTSVSVGMTTVQKTMGPGQMGLGPLLALQEVDAATAHTPPQAQPDEAA